MKKTKMMKKNYEFKKVFAKGKYFSGKYIEAFIRSDSNPENLFLGIAISVKIAKAVRRNYIKRLIRENYYLFEPEIKNGGHIIILVKKKVNINEISYEKIHEDMKNILENAEMI